jgi:squalene-hopene/tetraprenyl-beta-curcumene cyclase
MSPRREQTAEALDDAVAEAIRRSARVLMAERSASGYWSAAVTLADTALESEYILLQLWLQPPENGIWTPVTRPQIEKAARSILRRQLPDGGFARYPGGPCELNTTVKAYAALKLSGIPSDDARLTGARDAVLRVGGLQSANGFLQLTLSFFGLYPRELCPPVPPELILLPGGFPEGMDAWTRAMAVPLSILYGLRPLRPVPREFSLAELFVPGRDVATARTGDRLARWWEAKGSNSIRRKAIRRAEQWMLDRVKGSADLIAIRPALHYVVMALDALGYGPQHPDRVEVQRQLDALMIESEDEITFRFCSSPVRDTALASIALCESDCGSSLRDATSDYLRGANVSGWGARNEVCADADTSAAVLLALAKIKPSRDLAFKAAAASAVNWILSEQSSDGGWAAFESRTASRAGLRYFTFYDAAAMCDRISPDITGRVLEALCESGITSENPAVTRAVDYLFRSQEADGSWSGRWGVNYVYGTCHALRGLRSAGVSDREAPVLRAGEWLRSIQNADGGWGESCASYTEQCFVPAESTPSQTAWALLGLLAGGDDSSLSVSKGIEYLVDTQRVDGTWDEEPPTGTAFPRVSYLTHSLYRNSFPLFALSSLLKTRREIAKL